MVYTHFGEGEYDVTENNIRFLLGIKGGAVMPAVAPSYNIEQNMKPILAVNVLKILQPIPVW